MTRALALAAVLAACSSKPEPPPAASPPPPAEAKPVEATPAPFTLPLVIDRVTPGDMTTVELHVASDPAARFGLRIEPARGGIGHVLLVPTTADAGTRVVAAFAKAFEVEVPPVIPGGTLAPLEIAYLQTGEGTPPAMKLICASDTEVLLDWNLADKRGALARKSSDADPRVARCLARALRDGTPAERTPANDPTLAASGPEVTVGAKVGSDVGQVCGQTAERAVLADVVDGRGVLLAYDVATGKTTRLFATDTQLWGCECDASATTCVFTTGKEDTHAFLLRDGAVSEVPVPRDADGITVSPDGAWVVVSSQGAIDAFAPGQPSKARVALPAKQRGYPFDWLVQHGHTIAKVWTAEVAFDGTTTDRRAFRWDLQAAPAALVASTDDLPYGFASTTSPDGSRRFQLADGTLTITPQPSGPPRTLAFYPADAEEAKPGHVRWIDSRYLGFWRERGPFAFIDTDAMKLRFVPGRSWRLFVAPDMAHGFAYDPNDGLYALTIKKPL